MSRAARKRSSRRQRAILEAVEPRRLLSTIYVDVNSSGATHDGSSWGAAYVDLQQGLAAAISGDQIRVADGTYKPTDTFDRSVSFLLKTGVSVLGGYAGSGAPDPDARNVSLYPTILSGDIGTAGYSNDNSYHVVVGSGTNATAVLDGFTVTAGKTANDTGIDRGAGMYNVSGSPTVKNCNFSGNESTYSYGGGIYNSSSSPTLSNCIFSGNSADYGAGMANTSSSSPSLTNCTFIGNTAFTGGGMQNVSLSAPTLNNCIFIGNSARLGSASGGGMYNDNSASPTLNNCSFSGNSAGSYGGGIYSRSSTTTLSNCTLSGNSAVAGGGMYNQSSSTTLRNCILWGNVDLGGSQIALSSGTASVSYSDIQGGYSGIGNIDADPLFLRNPSAGADGTWGTTDDDYGDLRPSPDSPVVDAGSNSLVPGSITTDLPGNARFLDVPTTLDTGVGTAPIVDMGAYEAVAALASHAGGPYVVLVGGSLTLAGRGASDVAGALQFAWEWSGDGNFNEASGPSPAFPVAAYAANSIISVSLRVTDSLGRSTSSSTSVRVAPTAVYVDASAPSGGSGQSWNTAFDDLLQALGQAVPGQTIRVADGTYKPTSTTDRTISFQLTTGVSLLGGYAGFGAPNPDARNVDLYPSILSGDIGAAGDNSDNSYHVVVGSGTDASTVLDGFTITAGNANGSGGFNNGGGISNVYGSPTVTDCVFNANSASNGGGMYNGSSSPTLSNCVFSGNSGGSGAGMANWSSSPSLTNCTFTGNSGAGRGGGMWNSTSSPTLNNCIFTGNSAVHYGGGMHNESSSSPTLSNCTFSNNSAYWGGGMNNLSSPTLTNCTFSGNSAILSGAGMYNAGTSPTVTNCIIWGNVAPAYSQIRQTSGTASVSYSNIQGGWPGVGNVDVNPLFIRNPSAGADGKSATADDDYGDLRLSAASPLVDAGDNTAVPAGVVTDLAGNPRFADVPTTPDTGLGAAPIVDMGAYEAVAALTAHPGGPYAVLAAGSLSLAGRGASDVAGTLQYAWEWSGNGNFDEASGPSPVFPVAAYPANSVVSVSLRVTDSLGRSTVSNTSVRVAPTIVYVDASGAAGGTGLSWSTALNDLQQALELALPGQTIRVADGIYRPTSGTDREISFQLKNGVALLGGYGGFGAPNPDARNISLYPSILSGDIGAAGSNSDNSRHVVVGSGTSASAVLDGFTVTAGYADSTVGIGGGGGMYTFYGSPTVANCTFNGNSATTGGGGMFNGSSSPTLTNCIFSGNSAAANSFNDGGGGMCNFVSSPTLTNCIFIRNSAVACGGGMFNIGSSPTLMNCTFNGNSTTTNSSPNVGGGGMFNNQSSPTLSNCSFSGNSAGASGGGMHNLSSSASTKLSHCTFSGNTAGLYGGGLYSSTSSPTLGNCILWGNVAPAGSQIYRAGAANSVGTVSVSYSDIQGAWSGTGNIDADPLFLRNPSPGGDGTWATADDDYGDLRLQAASPCLDAGDNSLLPTGVVTDLAGNPRIVDAPNVRDFGALVDMGAYEYQPAATYLFDAPKPSLRMSFPFDVNPATLSASDLVLTSVATGLPVSFTATVSYDAASRSAVWQFSTPLPDGVYRTTIAAGSVADTGGNPLSTNILSQFFVLTADANRDGKVDINDLAILAANWNGSGKVFSQGDFNYDGKVDSLDLGILSSRWQQTMPPPVAPAAPISLKTRPPTRTATRVISLVL